MTDRPARAAGLAGIATALAAVAGAALAYTAVVTVLAVVGRATGLFTIASTVEQTELPMTAVAFLGLALSVETDGHIVVDVATSRMPIRTRRVVEAFWQVVLAAVLVLVAWLVVSKGVALHLAGRRSELLGLSPLLGHAIAGVGLVTAAAAGLMRAAAQSRRARLSRAPD